MRKPKNEQHIEGDNNVQAGRDVNIYNQFEKEEEVDRGIIDEIFKYVVSIVKPDASIGKSQPDKLLETKEKINLNFKSVDDQKEVRQYFTRAYLRLKYVERKFSELDTMVQSDVHTYIFSKYQAFKSTETKNIDILRKLFIEVTPEKKRDNPAFLNSAHAIVLLFFDDCTIFEKTEKEKSNQIDLFSDL